MQQLTMAGLICWVSVTPSEAGHCAARVGAVLSSATAMHAVEGSARRLTTRVTPVSQSELAKASVCLHLSVRTPQWWVDARTIQQEVARIWQSNGVTILYPDRRKGACPLPTSQTVLLLLVDTPEDLEKRVVATVSARAVGATVALNDVPTNLIVAFAERAVAAALQVPTCAVAPSRCVSLLLGRVIAHELGHVLLRTTAHMQVGLMRPNFAEPDFEDEPGDRYLLTAGERENILSHLRGSIPLAAGAPVAPAR